jgi:hypothetical protein
MGMRTSRLGALHFVLFVPELTVGSAHYEPMNAAELKKLEGRNVLVRSTADRHRPTVGVRGSIHLVRSETHPAEPKFEVVLDFPDMYTSRAHERIFVLQDDEVARLLAAENTGTYELFVDFPIDGPPDREVVGQK